METTTKITTGLNGESPWVAKSQLMSLQSTLFLRVRKYHIKQGRKILQDPENHGTCEICLLDITGMLYSSGLNMIA